MERIILLKRSNKKDGEIRLRFRLRDGRSVDLFHRSKILAYVADLDKFDELEQKIAAGQATLSELHDQISLAERHVKGLTTMAQNLEDVEICKTTNAGWCSIGYSVVGPYRHQLSLHEISQRWIDDLRAGRCTYCDLFNAHVGRESHLDPQQSHLLATALEVAALGPVASIGTGSGPETGTGLRWDGKTRDQLEEDRRRGRSL